MPEGFAESGEIRVRLVCDSDGGTSSYTTLDNLRIAFQDVALPTGLTRSIEAPVSGEMPAFALDVMPQTTTNGAVEEVSADLHLIVNGVTNIVPFAFADGMLTNALSQGDGEAVAVPMTLSAEALQAALGGPFLTGDAVSYFAAVHYNSANGDTDPAKVYETRYFPDNATTSTVNGTDYWIVEGAYGVNKDLSAHTFTVTGDALGCVGAPMVTTEGVTFTLHGYAEAGISNLTVTVNGTAYTPFEGLDTNAQVRVTGPFCLPTGLAANTDYTVTITAVDVNGVPLKSATFTFTTLPEVTGAVIAGVSTNEVKLTVSGAAAGYVVPSGWTPQDAHTWTRRDGTPNKMFEATVYGTNRLGQASAEVDATPGHTHAAAATRAPVVEKGVTTVTVCADGSYAASDDGNPEGTEYAIRITTSAGATNDVAVWKTLADWREHPETVAAPVLDLEAVNTFSFITRNFDGFVTTNETPVTASCSFPLTAGFVDGEVEQKRDGTVAFSLTFFDPAGSDGATAEVAYRLGDGAWQSVCEPFAVVFEDLAATRALVWDAWTAVGKAPGEYPYSLRTRVVSGDRASEWTEVSGTLDFAPPADFTVSGTPAPGAVTAERGYSFTLSAHDTHAVSYSWTLDGVAGTGVTVSGAAAQDGTHTLVVTATDALGNTSAPVTYTWTLDTTAPTAPVLSGAPADGVVTNAKEVNLTAASEDATALTYHWTFNGKEMEGEGAALTGTAQEGANEVRVYAEDAAGNRSETTTVTWTLDTTPPDLSLDGTPANGALTKENVVSLVARATDATDVTYHWTFNGVDSTGSSLAGTAREGANTVSVYAEDAAGNVSQTTTYSWTLDTIPPQNLSVNGTPAKDAKTKENAVNLTASATDVHALTYHWTFNGVDSTGPSLVGMAREGKNTARVFAEDAAGNRCDAVTYAWTVDTEKPTNLALDGTPANGAVTKEPAFGFSAKAEDATALTYHWTLKTATGERTATGETFDGAVEEDGAYTVSVFAEDETGNASETASRSWTVDRVAPTVELASETSESFNAEKAPLVVAVTFSEPVTNFTADAVTVANGTVTDVVKDGKTEAEDAKETYRVTIMPEKDGEVAVQIAAGVVADAAGNGNEASEVLTRTYDTTRPTVALTSEMTDFFNAEKLVVTATFSEAVTDFTADMVTVENGTVDAVEAVAGAENAYTVTVTPADEGKVVVEIGADQVADLAENKNAASEPLTRTYDVTSPTRPALSGVPKTPTNMKSFSLTATSEDANAITFHWTLNGKDVEGEDATFTGTAQEGANEVRVYAEDAAGNRSETTTVTWTLDTTPPDLSLDGTPANGALTKENVVSLVARATDATDVTYHWTFNGVDSTGASLVGTAQEGANTVNVYAEDAVGNRSETMTRTWTLDTTPPTKPELAGVPKQLTNEKAFSLTAHATDTHALIYHWTFNGATHVGETFAAAAQEGANTVSVYAEDAAGNVSQTTTYSWALDTTAPQGLVLTGTPGTVTKETAVNLTASATDANTLTYHWTFNGVDATGPSLVGTAQEGKNTVSVFAEDAAGNRCDAVTYTWTVDTEKPKNLVLDGTPANGAVTNVTVFGFSAKAEDATALTYHWTLKTATNERTATGETFGGEIEKDGAYRVSVSAEDAAGNVSDPVTWTWTVDTKTPTVTLTSLDDKENDLYNAHDTFMVQVVFSEPVTDFTADALTVENGEVKEDGVAEVEDAANTFLVTVTPTADGVVSVQIAAGAVTDRAGNKNDEDSNELKRTYDITPPTVTRFAVPDGILAEGDTPLDVTVTFSEPVTNFTAESVTVVNCDARAVREAGENSYIFTVVPIKNGTYSIQIADGVVADAAGNGNVASEVVTRIYDTDAPTKPVISGTPANGATVGTKVFSLTAEATDDTSGVKVFQWYVNGTSVRIIGKNSLTSEGRESLIHEGVNTVTVEVRDATKHWSEMSETYTWTYEPDATTGDVTFGGDVRVKVDSETGETNSVSFTAVAFKPGAASTFTLTGFEASTQDITDLQMWLVVCETLNGTPWRVQVNEAARFDSATGELTVTLPPEATLKKPDGKPYGSLFILGIDNKDAAE